MKNMKIQSWYPCAAPNCFIRWRGIRFAQIIGIDRRGHYSRSNNKSITQQVLRHFGKSCERLMTTFNQLTSNYCFKTKLVKGNLLLVFHNRGLPQWWRKRKQGRLQKTVHIVFDNNKQINEPFPSSPLSLFPRESKGVPKLFSCNLSRNAAL